MLTRRALLAAMPALALAPCGPTNPPQPGRVFIGRLDIYQPLHGSDPDPLLAQLSSDIEDWTRKAEEMARDLFGEPRPQARDAKIQNLGWHHEGYDLRPGPLPPGLEALLPGLKALART